MQTEWSQESSEAQQEVNSKKKDQNKQTNAKFREIRINVSIGVTSGKTHITGWMFLHLFHPVLFCSHNQKWSFLLPQAEFNLPPCQQLAPPQHSQRHFGHCQDYSHCQRKDYYPLNQWNLCQTQLSFQYSEHFIAACAWGNGSYLVINTEGQPIHHCCRCCMLWVGVIYMGTWNRCNR